jgi:hypothetical protein
MTELDRLMAAAFSSEGQQDAVNKVYLTLLRMPVFVPVQKRDPKKFISENTEEPFKPLFANIDGNFFMLIFDTLERLTVWAGDQFEHIDYVEISGRDIFFGINEEVYLGLNADTEFYKEFSPDEVKRVKMIIARIDQLRQEK